MDIPATAPRLPACGVRTRSKASNLVAVIPTEMYAEQFTAVATRRIYSTRARASGIVKSAVIASSIKCHSGNEKSSDKTHIERPDRKQETDTLNLKGLTPATTHGAGADSSCGEDNIRLSLVSWEPDKLVACGDSITKKRSIRIRANPKRLSVSDGETSSNSRTKGKAELINRKIEIESPEILPSASLVRKDSDAVDSLETTTTKETLSEASDTKPAISTADKFFCCPKCCMYFPAGRCSDFKTHLVEDCFVRKKHPCSECGHIFINQSVLEYHISHVHENPNPLSNLQRVKPRKSNKTDVSSEHEHILGFREDDGWPDNEEQSENIALETGSWRCWICFYESGVKGLWQTHMSRIHPDILGISLPCEHCDFKFTKKDHLREHLNEVHLAEIGFKCKDCGRKFLYKNFQHDCKKIECEVCGVILNSRGEKTKHLLSSHPEHRPYKCKECSKEFTKNEYLTIHMRIHQDSRPYQCEFCERSFRSKSHYNNHRRLHTGEKPYTCHTCGKSFFSPQCLCNHMVMHTGKKDLKCSDCDLSFRTKHDLRRHQMIHSGLRPFVCSFCGKTFNRRGNCTVHEKSHFTAKKEFTCEICLKDFDRLKKLNRHIREIHPKPTQNTDEALLPIKSKTQKSKRLRPSRENNSKDAEVESHPELKSLTVQFMDVEDVASNVEVAGEDAEMSDELEIQPLGVWEQAEFEFLNEDGTHVMPMYVTVLPCSDGASASYPETVEEIEVLDSESNSIHIEFEADTSDAKGYLEIVSSD